MAHYATTIIRGRAVLAGTPISCQRPSHLRSFKSAKVPQLLVRVDGSRHLTAKYIHRAVGSGSVFATLARDVLSQPSISPISNGLQPAIVPGPLHGRFRGNTVLDLPVR